MPKLMRTIAALLAIATIPLPAVGDETAEPDLDDLLLLPEWRLEYDPDDGMWSRTWRRTTNESVAFVNESLSDFWYIASSPVDWRWKEWGLFTGLVGTATLFVFYADEPIRDEAVESENFRQFSGKIGFLSDGTTLLALSGGFLLTGALWRDKEIETAKMLLESSAIGFGFTGAFKQIIGRSRPGEDGPREFNPFSGNVSMPSGETTHAFAMASVIADQYPNWPVRILSYGLATCVAAGRVGRDDHWTSDVMIGAAVGTFVGRSVVWLHHERDRRREQRKRLGLDPDPLRAQHSFHLTTRSIGWTVRY